MKLYRSLSRIPVLKKYTAKFMFVAFLGIHIPLFGIIGLLIASTDAPVNKVAIFLLTLGLTLLATTVTLFILNALVAPLAETQRSVSNYLATKTRPELPTDMTDEMGILMRDIDTIIAQMQTTIDEKDRIIRALSADLRVPALNIQASAELLKDEQPGEAAAKHVQSISNNIAQQLKLMDELTDKPRG